MKSSRLNWTLVLVLLSVAVLIAGCRTPASDNGSPATASAQEDAGSQVTLAATVMPPTESPVEPTATVSPSAVPPTETGTPQPTMTPSPPTATPTPVPVQTAFTVDEVVAQLQGLQIDAFFELSFKHLLLRDPELITTLGLADSFGLRNDRLNDLSDAYTTESHELRVAILDLLRGFDRSTLSEGEQTSYDVYEWYLDDLIRGFPFRYHNYPWHHFFGYHDELDLLFTQLHPLNSPEDIDDFMIRLSLVDDQVEQLLEGLKLREQMGIILPSFSIELSKQQIMGYLRMSGIDPATVQASQMSIYTSFGDRVRVLDGLDGNTRVALREEVLAELERSFIPAYLLMLDYLEHLSTIATDDAGVWKFPDGEAYYAWALRHETSTDMTAAEIHQLGIAEVARIQTEMRAVFDELGYPQEGTIAELTQRAIQEAGSIGTASTDGQNQAIAAYEEILEEVDQRLDAIIDVRPETELVVIANPAGGGGFYVSGSLDGSRPGAFHAGVGGGQLNKFEMATVAYHEAIPGHYLQDALAMELDLPLFRNVIFYNGYGEGWALYSERLAWELGLFEDDPYGNLGRLSLELLRAIRLVADSGIHELRWTREEAVAYMTENMGASGWVHEIDRYIVWPAQSTGYKVGMLKLLDLRQKAMDALGEQFDAREFHRVVLTSGSMPLEILEQAVDRYIDDKLNQ